MPAQQAQWNLGALMSARPQPVTPVTSGGEIFGQALTVLAQILQQQAQTKATTGIQQQQFGLAERQFGLQERQFGAQQAQAAQATGLGWGQLGQQESEFARTQAWEREKWEEEQTRITGAAKQKQYISQADYLFEVDPVTGEVRELWTAPIPTITAGVNEVAYNATLDKYVVGPVVAGQDEVVLDYLSGKLLYAPMMVIEDEDSLQKVIFKLTKVGEEYKWIQDGKPIDLPPIPETPAAIHFNVMEIVPGTQGAVLWSDKPDPVTGEIKYETVIIELSDWQKTAVDEVSRSINLIEEGIKADERIAKILNVTDITKFMAGLRVEEGKVKASIEIAELAAQVKVDVQTLENEMTKYVSDAVKELGYAGLDTETGLAILKMRATREEKTYLEIGEKAEFVRKLANDARQMVQGEQGIGVIGADFPSMIAKVAAEFKNSLLRHNDYLNMSDAEIEEAVLSESMIMFVTDPRFKARGGKITDVWEALKTVVPTQVEKIDIDVAGRAFWDSLTPKEQKKLTRDPEKLALKEALEGKRFSKDEIDKYFSDLKAGRTK